MKTDRLQLALGKLAKTWSTACLLTIVSAGIFYNSLFAEEQAKSLTVLEAKLEDAVRKASSPKGLHTCYSSHLEKLSKTELFTLRESKHTGIALQAAWRLVRQATEKNSAIVDENSLRPIDKPSARQFLNFVVGRLNIRLPEWWATGLVDARTRTTVSREILPFANFKAKRPLMPYESIYDFFCIPKGMSFGSKGDAFRLVSKSEDFFIPPECLEEFRYIDEEDGQERFDCFLEVLALNDRCYFLSTVEDVRSRYPLYLITKDANDRGCSPRIGWKTQVWVGSVVIPGGTGGGYYHWTHLQRCGDSVIVVGLCHESAYIEGFSLENGKNQFRFSTSY